MLFAADTSKKLVQIVENADFVGHDDTDLILARSVSQRAGCLFRREARPKLPDLWCHCINDWRCWSPRCIFENAVKSYVGPLALSINRLTCTIARVATFSPTVICVVRTAPTSFGSSRDGFEDTPIVADPVVQPVRHGRPVLPVMGVLDECAVCERAPVGAFPDRHTKFVT